MKIPFLWRGYRLFIRRYHFLGRMTDIGSVWKIYYHFPGGDEGNELVMKILFLWRGYR